VNEPSADLRATPVRTSRQRTCVGCGARDDAGALLRLVVASDAGGPKHEIGEVVFDLAGGSFGRGAHVHAVRACIEKTPRGLARAFRGAVKVDAAAVGKRLVEACDRRIAGLLVAARRARALALGADAAREALAEGAPLAVLAADAGSIAVTAEVQRCVAEGRAIAWSTKNEIGRLLGEPSVAICAVRHAGLAAELKRMRAAADAGLAATTEGAECSRFPEAR
jgi:predicted RNA-binding protein YlxR (DUF448 family)